MRKNPPQVYYHGSPVDDIKVLRKGSYVSLHYQTAYDMGRYYTKTGETWEDSDLESPITGGQLRYLRKEENPMESQHIYCRTL